MGNKLVRRAVAATMLALVPVATLAAPATVPQRSAGNRPSSTAWYGQIDASCGPGTLAAVYGDLNALDAADSSGDTAAVVANARSLVDTTTACLAVRPLADPVQVYLRSQMLTALLFRLADDDDPHATKPTASKIAHVASEICSSPNLQRESDPYRTARKMLHGVLEKLPPVQASAGASHALSPKLRECARRLGV